MAKVEMDLSEFKRMEQTETDLRASLKKEDTLNKEIIRLKQENIDILEANEKKVTIINETRSYQMIKQRRPGHLIDEYIENRIINYFNQPTYHTSDIRFRERGFSSDQFGKARMNPSTAARISQATGLDRDSLYDLFFENGYSQVMNQEESKQIVTHQGLDQVKADLKVSIVKQAEKDVKDKLQQLKDSKAIMSELRAEISEIKAVVKEQKSTLEMNDIVICESEDSVSKVTDLLKKTDEKLIHFTKVNKMSLSKAKETKDLLSDSSFINSNSTIKKLKKVWS